MVCGLWFVVCGMRFVVWGIWFGATVFWLLLRMSYLFGTTGFGPDKCEINASSSCSSGACITAAARISSSLIACGGDVSVAVDACCLWFGVDGLRFVVRSLQFEVHGLRFFPRVRIPSAVLEPHPQGRG